MNFMKCQSCNCAAANGDTKSFRISSKRSSFGFQRWIKVLQVL